LLNIVIHTIQAIKAASEVKRLLWCRLMNSNINFIINIAYNLFFSDESDNCNP